MPWYFLLTYAITGLALLLGLAAIPLAVRGVSRRVWGIHTVLAIALASALTVMAYVRIYFGVVPWWQVGAAYFAADCLPVLVAGWSARAAAHRWPTRRRLAAGLAGVAALACVSAAAVSVASGLLPDMITAEQ
jgi:hypothetical protein